MPGERGTNAHLQMPYTIFRFQENYRAGARTGAGKRGEGWQKRLGVPLKLLRDG